jgi:hypothetical protein
MNKERQSSRVTCFEHFYIKFVIHANRADWIQQRKCLNDNQHLNGSIEQTAIFEKKTFKPIEQRAGWQGDQTLQINFTQNVV